MKRLSLDSHAVYGLDSHRSLVSLPAETGCLTKNELNVAHAQRCGTLNS